MGRTRAALAGLAAAAATLFIGAGSAQAQTAEASAPVVSKPDPMTSAYLFGAAYKGSDLSTGKAGGMMFVPGRGLIRWETQGKTFDEQEELKTEAIGLADARAVQAEIDAQHAALDEMHRPSAERLSDPEALALATASGRAASPLSLGSVTGTDRQAGGAIALNNAGRNAAFNLPSVRNGSSFHGRNRVYMFGAVSGRAVGLNLMHDGGAGWRSGGLSTDEGGFVGQRQAGLAVRRGIAQAAVSLVQEKTEAHILGMTSIKDHRAMLSLSLIPGLQH